MTPADLVVLGAGPAGLAAAHRAAVQGHRVVVLEAADRVGGAAGSFEVAGLRVDHGSHRLHRAIAPEILRSLRDLLGDDLQRRERRGRIRLAGRWLPFPLRPVDTLTSLPPRIAAGAARDALTAALRSPEEDTFAEVVRAGLGPTMLERFYGPYAEKLWGRGPEELAGEQARVRITAASPGAIVRRIVSGADPGSRTFLYPRRGFGQLSEALADAAVAAGADLRVGSPASRLRQEGDEVVVGLDGGGEVTGRRVWSTIPLPVLARVTDGTPPAVLDAAASLSTRAMVLVYVVLAIPRYTRFDAHYLPERWTPVTRISEPKNYRDSHDDPPDRTVLCAEIPCDLGDRIWEADDDELGALVRAALVGADLPDLAPTEVVTRRLPHAYPVYDLGYEQHLTVLDDWAGSMDRVLTFGRQGLFVHDNSHHAFAMAWAAADALQPDGGFREDAWRRARERFAEHVVED